MIRNSHPWFVLALLLGFMQCAWAADDPSREFQVDIKVFSIIQGIDSYKWENSASGSRCTSLGGYGTEDSNSFSWDVDLMTTGSQFTADVQINLKGGKLVIPKPNYLFDLTNLAPVQ